jgi:hypothetical protein
MRKLALATALVFVMVGAATAGDYHSGATLNCAECHVMHGSQQHGYNSDGTGLTVDIGAAEPYEFLLRNHINELCLTCHDNQTFAPDVLGANGGVVYPDGHGRQAGALNRDNVAPYHDETGHTLGSMDIAPGGTWSNEDGLNCINCHTQHGRTFSSASIPQYRNLSVTTGVSYAIGTNDVTKDVFERVSSGASHYDIYNIDFNEPDPTGSAMGAYCMNCHTTFHGNSTDPDMRVQTGPAGQEWLRHPTADANIGALGGGHSQIGTRGWGGRAYRTQVMSPTGNWGTQGTAFGASGSPTDLTPSCFTCHKAHGNQNAFGLIYPTGAEMIDEEGDGTNAKNLCKQCHSQG